ncbi:MAG: putative sterol desaturase [bacterium]|nr:putative sterol desaturase [bacterium]
MSLFPILTIVLAASAVLMAGMAVAYRSPRLYARRLFSGEARRPSGAPFVARVASNMALSGALVYLMVYVGAPQLIRAQATSWAVAAIQTVTILALYDLTYYLMHRFAFHQWGWLKRVHAVHHTVRHPNALDSLYLHPLEMFLGLALLMLCVLAVGPVSVPTFLVVFTVYSFLNIVIHCGLDLPFFPFRISSYLARKHDVHHTSMRGRNFASISPLWDLLLGTLD